MKTITQKLWMVVVALCMSISATAYDFEDGGICYDITSFTDFEVVASSVSVDIENELVIPSEVMFKGKTLKVIGVANNFASNNDKLISVIISDGILSIGDDSFNKCSNLESIAISQSIVTIGSNTFANCAKLEKVEAYGVKEIGSSSFANCSNLIKVNFPNLLTVSSSLFSGCSQLSEIYMPSILSIGSYAFSNCKRIIRYDIPNDVSTIENYAFSNSGIEQINFNSNLKTIGENAFENCGIKDISIPSNVTSIGIDCFKGCSALNSISIGSGLKILYNIFSGCQNLKILRIEDSSAPLTIAYSGRRSIQETSKLVDFTSTFDRYNKSYYTYASSMFEDSSIENVYIGRNLKPEVFMYKRITYWCSYHESQIEAYENHYYIPRAPFSGSKICHLEIGPMVTDYDMEVSVGESTKSFGGGAFQDCKSLKCVTINSTSSVIPENTFLECSSLTNIVFPVSVKTLGNSVLANCSSLQEVTFGCYLSSIGNNALLGCSSLSTINIRNATPPSYKTGFSSQEYINTTINIPFGSLSAYQDSEPWKNFWNLKERDSLISMFEVDEIQYLVLSGDNVQIIGETLSSQKSLTIKNSVTYADKEFQIISIADNAFRNCTLIEGLEIEDGIMMIGDNAFNGCKNLYNVSLPETLNTLGKSVFKNCSKLKKCIWRKSINNLPDECFYGCTSLEDISLEGIESLGNSCFYNCDGLTKFILPSSIRSIGSDAFLSCSNLKEFIIEDAHSPIEFLAGSYYGATDIQKKQINGKTIQFKIQYYNAFFDGLPIEKLYIGRNLSDSPRYTISGDGGVDYYLITSYDGPFNNLPKLKELTIGENVDILGPNKMYISEVEMYVTSGAFKNCSSLEKVIVKNTTPPSGVEFSKTAYSKASLVVPDNTVSLYQVADGWKEFNNIFDETSAGIDEISVNDNDDCFIVNKAEIVYIGESIETVYVYGIDGKLIHSLVVNKNQSIALPNGMYVVRIRNKSFKVKI